jgi:hypothetical protein
VHSYVVASSVVTSFEKSRFETVVAYSLCACVSGVCLLKNVARRDVVGRLDPKGVFAVYDGVSGEPRRQRSREGCLLGASALRAAVCSRKAVNARESATFNLLRL